MNAQYTFVNPYTNEPMFSINYSCIKEAFSKYLHKSGYKKREIPSFVLGDFMKDLYYDIELIKGGQSEYRSFLHPSDVTEASLEYKDWLDLLSEYCYALPPVLILYGFDGLD